MKDIELYEVMPSKGISEVKVRSKGKDVVKFRCEKYNFIVIDKSNNEVRKFNRFTGSLVRNYYEDGSPQAYRPKAFKKDTKKGRKVVKEIDLLMKSISKKNIESLAFLQGKNSEFEEIYPDIIREASSLHKKRFNHE